MTERKEKKTIVSVWIWPIVVTLFLALMSFTVTSSTRTGRIDTRVETNTSEIEDLKEEKANRETVDMMYELQKEMNVKLDKIIENH